MKEHQITAKAKPKPLSAHVHLPVGSDVSGVVTKKDKNERRLEAMLRSIKNNADSHSPAGYAVIEPVGKFIREKTTLILLIVGILVGAVDAKEPKVAPAVLRRLPMPHNVQRQNGKEEKNHSEVEPLVFGCLTPPNYNKTITPDLTWDTDCDYISSYSCCIYRMFLYADDRYDFSLCSVDGVGASSDGDGDLEMFNSMGTSLWEIDGSFTCDYNASTLGTDYEGWSPPTDGYYYLKVSEYYGYSMNYCLAFSRSYDYYIQADSHPDNTVEVTFAFASYPGRVYFSRSPACGTLSPSYDDPVSSSGYYIVSTEYNPCETECSYVTVTADPTYGSNQTKTVHLDDRQHIWCCADSWERELGVTTYDAETLECAEAYVTVTVIPPEAGSVSPSSGNSYPYGGCYAFFSTYTPSCSYSGRVRVRFHTSGNDVIFSFDQNETLPAPPSSSWQTVSDSFCSEGLAWINYYQVYKMYLDADKSYNFSLCSNDGVGASCSGDGDLEMFDSSCTSLWYIDGAASCDYDASIFDWSPLSTGYYYLKVSEYYYNPMSYTLAYQVTGVTVSVSGYVETDEVVAIEGVLISANTGESTTTDINGDYELDFPSPWSGTITPTKIGWTFDPNEREYFGLTTDVTDADFTGTGILQVELDVDPNWMYQNLPGQTGCCLTATVSIMDDPLENTSYTYEWEFILPDDVSLPPAPVAGCGTSDPCCTFAARGCDEPNGLSDSGQPFTVKVTVTGDDYGNTATDEEQFGIALLGDVNNDCVVKVADRSIINAFWRLGEAGPFTFRDCDLNCDGVVKVADRSIANAVWRGILGQNSVTGPCPFR